MGNWGCAEGCGNVVNPTGFPSFPCPGARGKRGGDFLFKPPYRGLRLEQGLDFCCEKIKNFSF